MIVQKFGLLTLCTVLLAGCGGSTSTHSADAHNHQHAQEVSRTIEIRMDDNMRFEPQSIEVKKGETIRLQVSNAGAIAHELVLGPKHELLEHAEQMRQGSQHAHHSDNAITLQAGESGEILWTFKDSGVLDFACLIPGHYEAGMKGEAIVH